MRILFCFAGILAGMQAASAAEHQKVKVSGGLALSNKNMELIIRDRQFTPEFTSLALSVTGGTGNFYLTFNHDQSIKDDIESDSVGLIFYSRRDSSLALSYVLSREWRLSAGYRTGETESFYTVSNDQFGTSEKGFFAGGNFSYSFGKKGTASASLAIAQLDGEVSLREPFVDTSAFVVGSPPPQNIEGDALGYSFGLAWTGLAGSRTRYSIGLRIHRYEFEDTQVFGGLDLSYNLNFNSLYVGLTHSFN